MAKKSRRARRQATAAARPVQVTRPVRPQPQPAAKRVDFAAEYQYVVEDLKRIAIIALALFVLLIVLAFIIA